LKQAASIRAGTVPTPVQAASPVVSLFLYSLLVGLRRVLFFSLLLGASVLVGWHAVLRLHAMSRRERSNVLVLGTGELARELVREVLRRPQLGLTVKGFVDDKPELVGVSLVNPRVIGLTRDLTTLVPKHEVHRIVVELAERRGRLPVEELLGLKVKGIAIEDAATFYERVSGKIALENLKPSWLVFNEGFRLSRHSLILKQMLAVALSSALLLLISPFLPLIILLIKLDSRGPIVVGHKRIGQEQRVFTLWRFRTTEQDGEGETCTDRAATSDPRFTRIGRLLHKMRLDGIPQLWNVIRGDMTLIGPLAERREVGSGLENDNAVYRMRHSVKPGLIGWAQIKCGYGSVIEDAREVLQYDLYYVKNMSWILDAVIAFEAARSALRRRLSYAHRF